MRHPIAVQLLLARAGQRGVTQDVIAARVGVSVQTVQAWEAGKKNPSLHHLTAWAAALGLELALRETEAADAAA